MDTAEIESLRAKKRAAYEKDFTALKHLLTAADYGGALIALHYSREIHSGYRKDGVTPEHHHQVRMAFVALDDRVALLNAGIDPNVMIGIILKHDTSEDNPEIQRSTMEKRFGNARGAKEIIDGGFAMSKIREGELIPAEIYYPGLLDQAMLFLVKLIDRGDNMQTIYELPVPKQLAYLPETDHLLEVAKDVRKRFSPSIISLSRKYETTIRRAQQFYLCFASQMQYGNGAEVVAALDGAGHLTRPVPKSTIQAKGVDAA